ncbi:hypothetical protein EON81_11600 [bacterium]|nr:MAG: hypothetical protein EON81_11600 [bacterium]
MVRNFYVETFKIVPPLSGGWAWGARAYITMEDNSTKTLSEHWGEVEFEAEKKAQSELDEWLKIHGPR